jgi:hypothetical protein
MTEIKKNFELKEPSEAKNLQSGEILKKNVEELINEYSHWVLFYILSNNEPTVVHMASYKKEPTLLEIERTKDGLKQNPDFHLPDKIIDELSASMISKDAARDIIIENLEGLTYQQQKL